MTRPLRVGTRGSALARVQARIVASALAELCGPVEVPGAWALHGSFATEHGPSLTVPLIVKVRDDRTDARVALELALR